MQQPEKAMELRFLSVVQAPRWLSDRKENPIETVTWREYTFRTIGQAGKHRVQLSAILIPSIQKAVFGASVCAPSDRLNKQLGAAVSLGRARQQAFHLMAGNPLKESVLCGREVINIDPLYLHPSYEDTLWKTLATTRDALANLAIGYATHKADEKRKRRDD